MQEYRERQKFYYDRGTKPLEPLQPGDAVRKHTRRGWQPAEYVREAHTPRSHIVKSGDQALEYRRNRHKLMKTVEPPHEVRPKPRSYMPLNPSSIINKKSSPTVPRPVIPPPVSVSPPPLSSARPMMTRSGRESRLPRYLNDYVKYVNMYCG